MYNYLEDKELLRKMRSLSGEIMQSVCHYMKEDYDIGSVAFLVGSGAKNLILKNEKNPVDLDYNLEIKRCKNDEDCRYLKECAQKTFNKVLREYRLLDCRDSTSVLSSNLIRFESGNSTPFSIDMCIVKKDKNGNWYRLIHEKTGWTMYDKYYWNIAPQSKDLKRKVDEIKKQKKWALVREEYREIKNMYLMKNDHNHPSFICYVEAINNVHNTCKQKKKR